MTNFLEYRPHLQYKRELRAILRAYQGLEEGVPGDGDSDLVPGLLHPDTGEVVVSPEQSQPSALIARPGYIPSRSLEEYVDLTPTDVLVKAVEAIQAVDETVAHIIQELEKDVTLSPTIDEYIKAREDGALDLVYEFEDFHTDELTGNTGAEVLPVLMELKEEMLELSDFLADYLFPNELAKDLPYLEEQLARLEKEEEEAITLLIQEDSKSELDDDVLKETNHMLDFLYNRSENVVDFAEEVTLIVDQEAEKAYSGAGSDILGMMKDTASLEIQFKKLIKRRFSKHARNAADAKNRMNRLVDKQYKLTLMRYVEQKQKDKLESRETLESMFYLNPIDEADPLNIFFLDMAEEIKEIKDECDSLVEDLYRINELENIQMIDYLVSLEGKQTCRGLHAAP